MTRKVPLTIEEHRQIGAQLYEVYTHALRVYVYLANRLGKSKTLPRRVHQAVEHLSAARSKLDDELYRQFARSFDAHVYYPGTLVPGKMDEDESDAPLATLPSQLDAWAKIVADILGRLYTALPVSTPPVSRLEKAGLLLSWAAGTIRVDIPGCT